jgi:uncharacterized protein YdeI (YjbR/CyaY-like superfamily)
MTTNVETYLSMGCGRCARFNTPECSVKLWHPVVLELRRIIKKTALTETMKWGSPCYTFDGGNVMILGAMRSGVSLGFFKGGLMKDLHGLLEKPGENSTASRLLRFTDAQDVKNHEQQILDYLEEAIRVEKSGEKVPPRPVTDISIPPELLEAFEQDPSFQTAFFALTPGRQKSWLYHFNGAKQSATRHSRIEKAMAAIFEGRGMMDRN